MRRHGVTIADPAPAGLVAHLWAAAAPVSAARRAGMPAEARRLIEGNRSLGMSAEDGIGPSRATALPS